MLTNITRFLYYILFFATPLAVYSKTSELFEFNKMMLIYLLTASITFIWIINKLLTKTPITRKNIFFIPFILFLFSQILSTIFSIDVHTSFFGYYGRFNGGLLSIISYLTLFYIFIDNFNIKFLYRLLKISLISSIVVILWGLPGRFGYDLSCLVFTGELSSNCWTDQFRPAERLFSTLGQPNWLGAYLSILFFIGLFFLFRNDTSKIKDGIRTTGFYIFYLFLNFTAILFTRSESAIGAIVVSLLIFFGLFYKYGLKKKLHENFTIKKIAVLIFGLILLTLFFKTGSPSIDKYLSPLNLLKISKDQPGSSRPSVNPKTEKNKYATNIVTDSMDIRKIVWKGAVDLGRSNPLFGTGVETFAYSYYFKRPVEHNLTSEWDFLYNKAHNEFLNYLATTGYIGLSAYLIMILSVLFFIFKDILSKDTASQTNKIFESFSSYRVLLISLFCAYISILITNFFGFSTTSVNLFFYLIPAIIIGIYISNRSTKKDVKKALLTKDKIQKIQLGITVLFFLFTIMFLVRYYIADIKYAAGDAYSKEGDYKAVSSLLTEALNLHYEHIYEDKLSYALANLSYLTYYQKDAETAKTLVKLADYYNLKSIKSSPQNVIYWKTRAKNQYLFYQSSLNADNLNKGVEALIQARSLAKSDPKIPYSLALYYTLLDDDNENNNENNSYKAMSLKEVDEAIKLKPNFEDAYFLKGQLLKKYGLKKEANEVFQFILQNINPQNEDVKKELEE